MAVRLSFWKRFTVTGRGYTRTRRLLFVTSMVVGFATLTAGIGVDVWWSWGTFSFIPNALTSFAGFCVGVPVALLVLATLQAETEENSQLEKLDGLSVSAWTDFVARVEHFCSDDRILALRHASGDLARFWSGMIADALAFAGNPPYSSAHTNWKSPERSDAQYSEFVSNFRTSISELSDHLETVDTAVPDGLTLDIEWVGVRRSWNVLDTYVRVQRFERELSWMPTGLENRIQHKILRDSPLSAFSYAHDAKGIDAGHMGLADTPKYLGPICDLPPERLQQQLTSIFQPYMTASLASHRQRSRRRQSGSRATRVIRPVTLLLWAVQR